MKPNTSPMYGSSNWTLAAHSRKGIVANRTISETWPMLSRNGSCSGTKPRATSPRKQKLRTSCQEPWTDSDKVPYDTAYRSST